MKSIEINTKGLSELFKKKLFTLLTCDLDPDRGNHWSSAVYLWRNWCPPVPVTYFVRYDELINEHFGCHDYFIREFSNWIDRKRDTCEFGWHPHFHFQKGQHNNFEKIAQLANQFPLDRIVRVGHSYMSNQLLNIFCHNGYRMDSSAVVNQPCWPNIEDQPFWLTLDSATHSTLPILEVPLSICVENFKPINIAWRTDVFRSAVHAWIEQHSSRSANVLNIFFHPSDVHKKRGLFGAQIEGINKNLDYLAELPGIQFVKMSELLTKFAADSR